MADILFAGGVDSAAPGADRRANDADYEAGHGMEPLEDIHFERESIAARFAELKPRHGPAKMWEHERKSLLSLIELETRHTWGQTQQTTGMKMTEAAVDAVTHADPRYRQFIADGIATATEYEQLSLRMTGLQERANRGQVIGHMRSSEAYFEPTLAA